MNPDNFFYVAFAVATIAIGGTFVYRMVKYGSLKAVFFGAPIRRTLGEVSGSAEVATVSIKVHLLDGGDERALGLEIVVKSTASYQMMPVTLSRTEARKLGALLQSPAIGVQASLA